MTITHNRGSATPKIELDNVPIKNISNDDDEKYFKFLGFRMDNKLTWKHHTKHIKNKLSTANYILSASKNKFTSEIKKLLYSAIGQSHLEYGLPIWYNTQCSKEITKIQKKAIRNINNAKYNAHTDKLFAASRILKFNDLFEIAIVRSIRKTHKKQTPIQIQKIYSTHETDRPQRYPNNIQIAPNKGRIFHDIPKIWNNLPEQHKSINTSTKTTIKALKDNIFETYNNFECNKPDCYACKQDT